MWLSVAKSTHTHTHTHTHTPALQVNSVSSTELSLMQGGSLFPGRHISSSSPSPPPNPSPSPPPPPPPPHPAPHPDPPGSLASAPGDGSPTPLTCTHPPPPWQTTDLHRGCGLPPWRVSPHSLAQTGAVTKERTSHMRPATRWASCKSHSYAQMCSSVACTGESGEFAAFPNFLVF